MGTIIIKSGSKNTRLIARLVGFLFLELSWVNATKESLLFQHLLWLLGKDGGISFIVCLSVTFSSLLPVSFLKENTSLPPLLFSWQNLLVSRKGGMNIQVVLKLESSGILWYNKMLIAGGNFIIALVLIDDYEWCIYSVPFVRILRSGSETHL